MLTIKQLREKIKKTDADIIKKLAMREKLARKIGKLKIKSGKKVIDLAREKELMRYYKKLSIQYQLQPSFVIWLFKSIISQSRKVQKN